MTLKRTGFLIFVLVSALVFALNFPSNGAKDVLEKKTKPQNFEWKLSPRYFPFAASKTPEFTLVLPVLTYHYIREVPDPNADKLGVDLSVTPKNFEEQVAYLISNGYNTITPDDLFQALQNHNKLTPKSVILTFDDGYSDFYTNAFPILKKYNLKTTIFVVPGFLSDSDGRYLTWDELKELDQSGLITVGAHAMHHVDLVANEHREQEISNSKKALETFLGHDIQYFAYPYGDYNEKVVELVEKAGFKAAFTTRYGTAYIFNGRYIFPRTRISGNFSLEKFAQRLDPTKKLSKASIAHSHPKG